MMEVIGSYTVIAENVPGEVTIIKKPQEYTPIYEVKFPVIEPATQAVLDSIKEKLVEVVNIKVSEILDPKAIESIKERFIDSARQAISQNLPALDDNKKNILAGHLVHDGSLRRSHG